MVFLYKDKEIIKYLQIKYKYDATRIVNDHPQDFEILGWCPAGPVLPHGEKVPL